MVSSFSVVQLCTGLYFMLMCRAQTVQLLFQRLSSFNSIQMVWVKTGDGSTFIVPVFFYCERAGAVVIGAD